MNRTIDPSQLPALSSLHKASVAAVLVASTLFVTTVLPAEYAVDPTGVGALLGLTAMGELKAGPAVVEEPYAPHEDVTRVLLGPGQGTEVKAHLQEGAVWTYAWSTSDGAELFYDFHGEPKGAAPDVFTSHEKGLLAETNGVFTVPFEGTHGWYWKNKTDQPVTVTLTTSGVYKGLKQLH